MISNVTYLFNSKLNIYVTHSSDFNMGKRKINSSLLGVIELKKGNFYRSIKKELKGQGHMIYLCPQYIEYNIPSVYFEFFILKDPKAGVFENDLLSQMMTSIVKPLNGKSSNPEGNSTVLGYLGLLLTE